jgi:hypothetical protein
MLLVESIENQVQFKQSPPATPAHTIKFGHDGLRAPKRCA